MVLTYSTNDLKKPDFDWPLNWQQMIGLSDGSTPNPTRPNSWTALERIARKIVGIFFYFLKKIDATWHLVKGKERNIRESLILHGSLERPHDTSYRVTMYLD